MGDKAIGSFIGTVVVWAIMIVVFGGMYGCPRYNVWQQNNLNDKTVVYIPTEANLPLLEAQRK
ncbi:MAG: hypothetical protein EGQ00_02380 [Parabacteroides johnsonii]|jgi:hypothetical protein|nr:hypothetical protein [Parabacteroides johnsonii]